MDSGGFGPNERPKSYLVKVLIPHHSQLRYSRNGPMPTQISVGEKTWKLFNIEQYLCFLNELLPKASSINPVTGVCFVCMLSANLNKQIPPVASLSQSQNQHGKELRGNLEEFLTATLQRAGGVHPLWNLRNRQVQGVWFQAALEAWQVS